MSKYARRPRDRAYLTWIRSLPCFLCGTRFRVEAAHVGPRAFGQKCPDREVLPICRWDHRIGPHSHHKLGRKFWMFWKLDKEQLIQKFNEQFEGFVG